MARFAADAVAQDETTGTARRRRVVGVAGEADARLLRRLRESELARDVR